MALASPAASTRRSRPYDAPRWPWLVPIGVFVAVAVAVFVAVAVAVLVGVFALSALGILTVGWHPLTMLRQREKEEGGRETDVPAPAKKIRALPSR